jgi:hypothetical protein
MCPRTRPARLTGPPAAGRGSRRYLLLSATMGSGHDAVAAVLSDRLTATGHQVGRADVLDLLPAGLGHLIRSFYQATIRHLPDLYAGMPRNSVPAAHNQADTGKLYRTAI